MIQLHRGGSPPSARPARSLKRQQREWLLIYMASLAGVLMVFAVVAREGFRNIAMADLRGQLMLIGEDFSSLPLPEPGNEKDLQGTRKDFATAHQQVEWFVHSDTQPQSRLGEWRNLGPLPKRTANQRMIWQETDESLALVRPADADGVNSSGRPLVWLRISQGLEPLEKRLHQLDLAIGGAVCLALLISAGTATLLARRVLRPLERSLRRLREFGMDASHELRGPLAALSANAEMGMLDCTDADSPQRRRFAAIASTADQMQRLVDDLLLVVRQDEGRLEQPNRLELASLVRQQISLYSDAFQRRHQHLESDLEEGLEVIGQATLLHQLVRNLLDNAHRYCPDGATVMLKLWRRGRLVCLELSDDGPGIPAEQLPRVFDRFWRASPDRSDGGNGMGLAIAARISRAHGGDIRVTSVPGQGSRFLVELPLAFG